ncbi:uncharacterized protein BO88DRAFT_45921 [Aspergillus vadensis CBS 113365]|uniref:Uncharacterized protein n=1 Tax=Aspergillus vadensis (strain CBS 113365 / IMI 142717 / IBT 24658) TaxID=1448311 RepID=A0A319B9P5_ASPVC|nr:hypothetical protein BO88DRAFT_45921 [Aspergillus vadensis CBS 113365]PYH69285.1 hypothetical protein BO88DRAFT_45921 [Aspergillus vadensis CBS 113365]
MSIGCDERTGRFQWCRQHHGFHDPWRYDVKKRPITEEAHMPRQPLSRVFRFKFSIFCLFGSSPWDNSRSLKSAKSVSREARRQCDIMGAVRDDCFSPSRSDFDLTV